MKELTLALVGTGFKGAAAIDEVMALALGQIIELRRDKANDKDVYAVQCWANGLWVGYLPATDNHLNKPVADHLDSGGKADAKVNRLPTMRGRKIKEQPLLVITLA